MKGLIVLWLLLFVGIRQTKGQQSVTGDSTGKPPTREGGNTKGLQKPDSVHTQIPHSINKDSLSQDPSFNQLLRQRIIYPSEAWTRAIYGRVYVEFGVSSVGQIENVTIVSPDNIGYGFIESIMQAFTRLPAIDPAYRGHYILPVTFTYTNTQERRGTHTPINYLDDYLLRGRVVLKEFVVPIIVSKPVIASHEVWGYYK